MDSQSSNNIKSLDYSKKEYWGYTGSGNRSYTITATEDGVLCGYLSVYSAAVSIIVNDILVGIMTSNDPGGSVGSSFSHPIFSGDIVKIVGSGSDANNAVVYFIPYK